MADQEMETAALSEPATQPLVPHVGKNTSADIEVPAKASILWTVNETSNLGTPLIVQVPALNDRWVVFTTNTAGEVVAYDLAGDGRGGAEVLWREPFGDTGHGGGQIQRLVRYPNGLNRR